MEEGSSWETFDPMSVIKKWIIDKVTYITDEKGPRSYKSHNSAKLNAKFFSDDHSYDEEDNICLFSSILVAKWTVHNYVMLNKKTSTFWVNMLYFLILILLTFFHNDGTDDFTDIFMKC